MISGVTLLLLTLLTTDPPTDQVHAYVPVEFAAMAEPVNGTTTVLTNFGLFETDAAGTIIRQIHASGENQSGQQNMNGFTPSPDGDFAYIVSNNFYSPYHCAPSSMTGVIGGDIYRFDGQELTHIMQHSGNARVIRDPSGEFWIIDYFVATGYDGVFRLYRLEDDQPTHFTEFTYGQSFWYDEEAEGLVVGYSTENMDRLGSFFGTKFQRWNGDEFEPIDQPAIPPPINLNASNLSPNQELRKTLGDQLPWMPKNESQSFIPAIEEAPDGSVWAVERTLWFVCAAAKETTSEVQTWNEYDFRYISDSLEGGQLIRRHASDTEEHGAWVRESDDFYGIADMALQPNGNPLISTQNRFPSIGTTESNPAAWYYEDRDSPLVMLPDGITRRSFMRDHYLEKANAGRWFVYSPGPADDSLYLLDEDGLHTIALPDSLSLHAALGIHPAGEDRWRMYALSGAQIDVVLP
ncbi:MAG: hypothetical protein LAT57_08120, partial [Balneolales bacterium]|nr:hypothetical protein [Balneolales bacterium]